MIYRKHIVLKVVKNVTKKAQFLWTTSVNKKWAKSVLIGMSKRELLYARSCTDTVSERSKIF